MEDKITESEQKNILNSKKEPLINKEIKFYIKVLHIPIILDQIFQFLENDVFFFMLKSDI